MKRKIENILNLDSSFGINGDVLAESTRIIGSIYKLDQEMAEMIKNAYPGPNGEMMILLRNGPKESEIIIYPNKSIYVNFNGKNFSNKGDYNDNKLESIFHFLKNVE